MSEQNKYRVAVSQEAAQMLTQHAAFLAQVSPAAAERLTVAFETAANSLEEMPQRCPTLSREYLGYGGYRFLLLEKRYLLLFQIIGDTVHIDYMIDARQDYIWLIK